MRTVKMVRQSSLPSSSFALSLIRLDYDSHNNDCLKKNCHHSWTFCIGTSLLFLDSAYWSIMVENFVNFTLLIEQIVDTGFDLVDRADFLLVLVDCTIFIFHKTCLLNQLCASPIQCMQ